VHNFPEFNSVADLKAHYRNVFARRPAQTEPPAPPPKSTYAAVEKKMLPPEPPPPPPPPPPLPKMPLHRAARIVCDHYGVSWAVLVSGRRRADLVLPRHVLFYLCRDVAKISLPRIGYMFGGRDHTTILHATRKIKKQMTRDRELFAAIWDMSDRYHGEG